MLDINDYMLYNELQPRYIGNRRHNKDNKNNYGKYIIFTSDDLRTLKRNIYIIIRIFILLSSLFVMGFIGSTYMYITYVFVSVVFDIITLGLMTAIDDISWLYSS